MRILGVKPGHDGAFALIEDGTLKFSFEAEKNSFPRFSHVTPSCLLDAAAHCGGSPDCIALSGWNRAWGRDEPLVGMGYWGVSSQDLRKSEILFFGQQVKLFEGTHEASHVWCSYGMSPYADTYPCYVLVWEGWIGRFYRLDRGGVVTAYPQILEGPGSKYAFIFMLADPSYIEGSTPFRFDDAGKLMALVSYGAERAATPEERELIDWVLERDGIMRAQPKTELAGSSFHNIGLRSQAFADLARAHSNAIFDLFAQWAEHNLDRGLPLVIGGGCGLNCNWNTAWVQSGLFSEVFVPPCVNDTGSAIGSAIQAQHSLTGQAAIKWGVYCGSPQKLRGEELRRKGVDSVPAEPEEIAADLAEGHIVAVMRGPCEIGPRALGARSLLADPRSSAMRDRLNVIKQREDYRPIAPICTAEAAPAFFDTPTYDKYMLFFSTVRDSRIPAVTHVDNSARVQVVSQDDNAFVWSVLRAFGERTGLPVLCNTSLNFKGKGFIDDLDDLLQYCQERGIDRAVCEDAYIRL